MIYNTIQPDLDLSAYISHFWTGSWDAVAEPAQDKHVIIANRLLEITFAFTNGERQADLLFTTVQGQTHKPRQYSVPAFYHLFGVSIFCHAIPILFGCSPAEISHQYLSFDTFIGGASRMLIEQVASAGSTAERVNILSNFFRDRLSGRPFRDQLMLNFLNDIKAIGNTIPIHKLVENYPLSQKQFTRRFKEFTGFCPKMFTRISRLETVINTYSNSVSLAALIYENGFYDQAHFINEFKNLTGFRPTVFWTLGT